MKISSKKCPKCGKNGMVETAKGWQCMWCFPKMPYTEEQMEWARRRIRPSTN